MKILKNTLLRSTLILCMPAMIWAAPSLTVGTTSGQAGTSVTLPITFDPTTASVAGIQFNLTIPAGLSTGTVTGGSILNTAGKSVSTNLIGNTWTFIIFGLNQTTIASGSLLTAQLNIAAGASAGSLNVPVSGVIYSDPSGTAIAAGTSTGGSVTVTVPSPVISSVGTATGQVGAAFSYQITASNSPTSFNATGLPAGLSVNTTSGLISGTPTSAATTNVTLSATNAGGTGTNTLTLTINSAIPVISSTGIATGQVGVPFSYQISATNSPTSFNATGLPAGLSVNTVSGLISGTPTTAATTNVTMSATNSGGTGTKTLSLKVNPATPVITSAGTSTGQVGIAFSYQITASNSPTSFSATGLPAGLSVNTVSGLISGTPTAMGISNVGLSAANSGGTGTQALTLTVSHSPCDLSGDGATNTIDLQLTVNQSIGITACSTADINKDTFCNIIDVQRVVNAVIGGTCVVTP